MTMKDMYVEKMKELKELGLMLLDSDEYEEDTFFDEVENMDMHFECALDILTD